MKKIIISTFCLLITLVTFAQLPEYVISNEWETSNQQKAEKLMNDWKNLILEMDENTMSNVRNQQATVKNKKTHENTNK